MDISWQGISGHKRITAQLRKLVRNGRFPHAFLFYGPPGVGKRRVAEAFAASLLCGEDGAPCGSCASCRALQAGAHPDYFPVEPQVKGIKYDDIEVKDNKDKENDKDKTDKKKLSGKARAIRIEDIRLLETELSRLPILSKRRVVIIDEAPLMTEQAANSLLKTLEEPGEAVVFVLIAPAKESLLPTIVSRCTPIAFGTLSKEEIAEALVKRGADSSRAVNIAALADGSFGTALKLFDADSDRPAEVLGVLKKLRGLPLDKLVAEAAGLSEMDKEELGEWLRYLRMLLRDLLVLLAGGEDIYNQAVAGELAELLPEWPAGKVMKALEITADEERRNNSNANRNLQLTAFFMRLQDLIEED